MNPCYKWLEKRWAWVAVHGFLFFKAYLPGPLLPFPILYFLEVGLVAPPAVLLLSFFAGRGRAMPILMPTPRAALGGGQWLPPLPSSFLLEERGGLSIIYAHAHASARSPTVFLFFYLLEGGGQAYQPALPVPVPVPKLVRSRLAATLSVFFFFFP